MLEQLKQQGCRAPEDIVPVNGAVRLKYLPELARRFAPFI